MRKDIFDAELNRRNFTGFVWPTVLMMVVLALYYAIDSIFVANFAGEIPLAAMNIAYPVIGIVWGLSVMLSAGASSLVGIEMGIGNDEDADSHFTLSIAAGLVIGIGCTIIIFLFLEPLVAFLGATEDLAAGSMEFLKIYLWACPLAFTGVLLEFYIRVDGRPGYTIFLYVGGGAVHLVLDIILMGPFNMGLSGAALANIAGLMTTTIVGLLYFLFKDTRLNFRRFKPDFTFIRRSIVNGSPEFINESSAGIMIFFYNLVFVGLAGETGVAAVAIVQNLIYLFMSVEIGFGAGVLPLLSYYYGAGSTGRINRVLKYSRYFVLISSVLMAVLVIVFAGPLVTLYENPGSELYEMSVEGLRLSAISLLFSGINIYASSFFMGFGKGGISFIVSVSRGIVFVNAGIFLLSWLFGITGAWCAMVFSDAITFGISLGLLKKYSGPLGYRVMGE